MFFLILVILKQVGIIFDGPLIVHQMEEFPDSSNDNKLENQKNIYKVDIDKLLGFRHVAKSNQEDLIEMMYFNYKVVFNNELELIYLEKQFSGEKPVWPKKTESKKD